MYSAFEFFIHLCKYLLYWNNYSLGLFSKSSGKSIVSVFKKKHQKVNKIDYHIFLNLIVIIFKTIHHLTRSEKIRNYSLSKTPFSFFFLINLHFILTNWILSHKYNTGLASQWPYKCVTSEFIIRSLFRFIVIVR